MPDEQKSAYITAALVAPVSCIHEIFATIDSSITHNVSVFAMYRASCKEKVTPFVSYGVKDTTSLLPQDVSSCIGNTVKIFTAIDGFTR